MTTAIVTITCPSCGGRIDHVTSTDEEQTIKCRFCGMDLHIPRVGAVVHEVVHEVIREVPSTPVYQTDQVMSLRPQTNWTGPRIAVVLGLFALMPIMMVGMNHSADVSIKKLDTCEADCDTSCEHAGDKEPPDKEGSYGFQAMMQSSDRRVCGSRCYQANNCSSSDR